METCPTFYGVEDSDLKELAEAVQILQTGGQKEWSDDNLISVFDELTGTGNKPENNQMPSKSLVHMYTLCLHHKNLDIIGSWNYWDM